MAAESPRGPGIRELESLRISRPTAPPHRNRMMTTVIAVAAIAVIIGAGYAVYTRTLGRPVEVEVAVVTVKQGGQTATILTGSGYIITEHKYIVIGTKILGQIIEEPIEEGRRVKKGDLLARIDDRDYRAQLRQALAERELARANVSLKATQATRLRELYANSVESKDQFDIAENALAVARAQLLKAQGAVDYARFNVDQCVITSPINGIVLKKYREVGDTINYGGDIQAGGGTTDIVQLADTTDMRTEVDVNESDIAKVAMGQPATVVPDAYADRSFDAVVVKIYPEADRQKGTIKAEVRILHPDLNVIKPEMSARVIFLAGTPHREAPMVIVPKKAIVKGNAGASVWAVRDGIATRVPIVTGREFQDGVEVKAGLEGGELVIIMPPANLENGARVVAVAS